MRGACFFLVLFGFIMLFWILDAGITKSQAASVKQLMETNTMTFDSQHFNCAKDLQNEGMHLINRTV